ncbi:hypothetical protein EV126DRAFT_401916 [Verticillium dahliae]|nr:hypothetical protein EV126DRAFT_401916 [Verticillium dahliae]
MAARSPTGAPVEEPKLGVPSLNPLPLSASQEAQVRDIYYARVRAACAPEIKGTNWLTSSASLAPPPIPPSPLTAHAEPAFAECALGRTLSIPFVCRTPHRAMNSCMVSHATQAEQDAAREDWFAQRLERQRERERKAQKKAGQEEFLREWWGLPEKDAETRRREEEKAARAERVGGYAARNRVRWGESEAAPTGEETKKR